MNDLGVETRMKLENVWEFEARDRHGRLKWRERVKNLVTTEGLNDLLTKYLKGAAYTAAWYVGLVDNANWTAFAATDTAAKINLTANPPTTNGWQEANDYTEGVRQTLTLGTAAGSSISNTASKAVFTVNGTVVLKGGFVASVSTVGGTTGVLYGEAAFSALRSLEADDTLTVTVTLTATSA